MSRYDDVPTTTLDVADAEGSRRRVRYYQRRFPPAPGAMSALATHVVAPSDRLDLLSFRYTGDPLGFWRICDANAAVDPDDLVGNDAVGSEIAIPLPGMPQ